VKGTIKIKRLTLENFKGIKRFEAVFDGKDAIIEGDNATGKTTLADAFYWLLFEKDSLDRKEFGIKTLDSETGQPLQGVEHKAEIVLDLGDRELKLAKAYKEKWTQKKGAAKKHFSGHTTDYHIDDVPVQKKEYQEAVQSIVPDEGVFKLLTGAKYFNEQLHWKQRRDLLLEVCGDVTDEEVISNDEKLKKLPDIIGNKTAEDHKKQVQERQKKINKELESIPVRIDEVNQSLPDIKGMDAIERQQALEVAEKELEAAKDKLKNIKEGGQAAVLQREINELTSAVNIEKNKAADSVYEQKGELENEIGELDRETKQLDHDLKLAKHTVETKEQEIRQLGKDMEALRTEWKTINAKPFDSSETCPYCEQALPEEKIEQTREAFNLEKSQQLEEISKKGKDKKAVVDQLKHEVSQEQEKIADLEAKLADCREALEAKQAEKVALEKTLEKKQAEAAAKAQEELDQKKQELQELQDNQAEAIQQQEAAVQTAADVVKSRQQDLQALQDHDSKQQRIKELKQQEKDLSAEWENLQEQLELCDRFVRAKVDLLDEKINSKFELARFKMFDTYISGGIEETCETLFDNVQYRDLNSGHKIIIGLDIIRTLAAHYEQEAPVFIDNAESVTGEYLPELESQVIQLVKPAIKTEADREKYSLLQVTTL